MKNLLLIVVAALLLAAIGGAGWFLLSETEDTPLAGRTGDVQLSDSAAEDAGLVNPGEQSALTRGEQRQEALSPVASGRVLVRGQVRKPFSAPDDSELEAYAVADAHEYDEFRQLLVRSSEEQLAEILLDRAPVAADGSFELNFPGELQTGFVLVAGKFLYAMESSSVDLVTPESVEIDLAVGCFLNGTLIAPETSARAASLAGTRVLLDVDGFALSEKPDPRNTVTCELTSDAQGHFELRALPAEYVYKLQVIPEQYAAQTISLSSLPMGEVLEVEVRLGDGGQISGRVLDPDGEPVENAFVRASLNGTSFGFEAVEVASAITNTQGEFLITSMPLGSVGLRANHLDFLESKRVDVAIKEGSTTTGIEIELVAGRQLTGLVNWPNGEPAKDAQIRIEFDSAYLAGPTAFNALRGATGETMTGPDGRFLVNGMGGGPFIITAEARPLDLEPTPEGEQEDLSKWFTARAESVQPDSDIQLLLHGPLGIQGRVMDDKKEPLTKFTVCAVRRAAGGFGKVAMENRQETFESPDGTFHMVDLTEGNWEVVIVSEGFVSQQSTPVQVPTDEPLLLQLVRSASITGRVLTPAGTPVADAIVFVDSGQPSFQNAMTSVDERVKAKSDSGGFFEFKNLPPSSTALFATHDDYCESESEPFELTPGAQFEDAELRLRAGGQLTGLVYDKSGELAGGYLIVLNSAAMNQKFATTNPEGEFKVEHVAPGSWQVIAMDSSSDYSADSDGGNSGLMGAIRMSQAEIIDGETTHVVIGAPPADPVKITGEVTHAGEPFVGATLIFFREGTKLYENMKFATFEEDGRYSIVVDGPGDYVVVLQKMGRTQVQQQNVEFSLDVPLVEEYIHDFEVPGGRITGQVTDGAGLPAVDARVTLATDGGFRSDVLMGGQYSEVQTDSQGKFDLKGLRAGTYAVSAGGAMLLDFGGGATTSVGRVTRGGVRLGDNEWKKDFNFQLEAPGSVEVTLLGLDGQPLEGAGIFLRDSQGRPVEAFNYASTKATGRCLIQGLAAGDYTVMGRKGLGSSQESPPFRVVTGKTEKVELRLEEGTILWIKLKDKDGEDTRAALSVIDKETGQDWAAFFGMDDLQVLYLDGEFSPTEHRLGPLPPGKYKIQAHGDAGTKSKPVTLRGEPERKVTLRLK